MLTSYCSVFHTKFNKVYLLVDNSSIAVGVFLLLTQRSTEENGGQRFILVLTSSRYFSSSPWLLLGSAFLLCCRQYLLSSSSSFSRFIFLVSLNSIHLSSLYPTSQSHLCRVTLLHPSHMAIPPRHLQRASLIFSVIDTTPGSILVASFFLSLSQTCVRQSTKVIYIKRPLYTIESLL